MDKSQHLVELDQIKQIINSFNSKSLKESLLIAHHNKLLKTNFASCLILKKPLILEII